MQQLPLFLRLAPTLCPLNVVVVVVVVAPLLEFTTTSQQQSSGRVLRQRLHLLAYPHLCLTGFLTTPQPLCIVGTPIGVIPGIRYFRYPAINPFRGPEPLHIQNPSNFFPQNGFPVGEGLILRGHGVFHRSGCTFFFFPHCQ